MDAVWILLAVVVAWFAMSRLMPGMGGGWGPKKQCGWTPPSAPDKTDPEDKDSQAK